MRNYWFAILALVVVLSSCQSQNLLQSSATNNQQVDSVFSYERGYSYKIRKDDKVSISVWDHEELSVGSIYGIYNANEVYGRWLLVDSDGDVTLPKTGDFHIQGLTVTQAEDSLKVVLEYWIPNPIVEVKVLNKEITAVGELKHPGTFKMDKEEYTLLEVIGLAGDFDYYANKKEVKIVRQQDDQVHELVVDLTDMSNYRMTNIQIKPGDVIYVPSKKHKEFDKRAATTVVPFASVLTAAAIFFSAFF
jgi:polysaccharide biosynthesis/export protein